MKKDCREHLESDRESLFFLGALLGIVAFGFLAPTWLIAVVGVLMTIGVVLIVTWILFTSGRYLYCRFIENKKP